MHSIKLTIINISLDFRNEQNVTAAKRHFPHLFTTLPCVYNIASLCSHQYHSDEWSLNLNVQTIDWKYGCGGEAVCYYPCCQGNTSALTSDGVHIFSVKSFNTHGLVMFLWIVLVQYSYKWREIIPSTLKGWKKVK